MKTKNILTSTLLLISGALLFYVAGNTFHTTPFLQIGADGKLPDGSRYYGEMKDGLFNGKGTLTWDNGDKYSGAFKDGLFSGHGTMTWESRAKYTGDFKKGLLHGKGEMNFRNGDVYIGEFQSDLLHGQGKFTTKDMAIYTGGFVKDAFTGKGEINNTTEGYQYKGEVKDWLVNGKGRYTMADGSIFDGVFDNGSFTGKGTQTDAQKNIYTGTFKDWSLEGEGIFKGANGDTYVGSFETSAYKGQGKLSYANGNVYTGEFEFGLAHGDGHITYAKPNKGISEHTGKWIYGKFQDPAKKERQQRSNVRAEALLYTEQDRLNKALALVDSGKNNQPDLFFIGVGGDGRQQVFKREVEFAANKINKIYANSGHSLQLVNTYVEKTDHPLATRESLRQSLNNISEKMEADKDVLFLYLTSHGSKTFSLSLHQPSINLPNMKATELKRMLDKTNIKWKIIVVSACFSGGFIPALEDSHTLVITAADSKSKSFGCSDEAELTRFAKAFLRDALQPGVSISDAFEQARILITQWEKEEKTKEPSNPQISMGDKIEKYLSTILSRSHSDKMAAQNTN